MSENQGAPQGDAQGAAGAQHDGGAAVAERIAAIEERGTRTLTGRVVSTKMQKTVAVEIVRLIRHMPYGKFIRRTTKLLAHDESSQSKQGDLVAIAPCRPLSRRKSWRVIEVLEKAAP